MLYLHGIWQKDVRVNAPWADLERPAEQEKSLARLLGWKRHFELRAKPSSEETPEEKH
jgi:hypothetical protein